MGAVRDTLRCNDFERSYCPPIGLAAAKIEVRAFKVALTPAYKAVKIIKCLGLQNVHLSQKIRGISTLAIEIVCCSIAS